MRKYETPELDVISFGKAQVVVEDSILEDGEIGNPGEDW